MGDKDINIHVFDRPALNAVINYCFGKEYLRRLHYFEYRKPARKDDSNYRYKVILNASETCYKASFLHRYQKEKQYTKHRYINGLSRIQESTRRIRRTTHGFHSEDQKDINALQGELANSQSQSHTAVDSKEHTFLTVFFFFALSRAHGIPGYRASLAHGGQPCPQVVPDAHLRSQRCCCEVAILVLLDEAPQGQEGQR